MVAGLAFFYYENNRQGEIEIDDPLEQAFPQTNMEEINQPDEVAINKEVVIDVKGAVVKPGVYVMKNGDRIHHVIERAGGLTNDANELSINLAALLEDGMVVYVPKNGEESDQIATSVVTAGATDSNKVNINKATLEELQTLSGIGPSKATAILSYRDESGPFKKEEDLLNVSGIGEKTFEKLKEHITVK